MVEMYITYMDSYLKNIIISLSRSVKINLSKI